MTTQAWKRPIRQAGTVVVFLIMFTLVLLGENAWAFLSLVLLAPLFYSLIFSDYGPLYPYGALYPYHRNADIPSTRSQIAGLCDLAKRDIRITTRTLCQRVYDEEPVLNAIERALRRGVRIKLLIIGDEFPERLKVSSHWINHRSVTVHHIPGDWPHFITVDGLHTRIERRRKEGEVARKAICRYGGHELARHANQFFDELFERKQAA